MHHWQFTNYWHHELPGTYHAQLADPIQNPSLIAYSSATADLLDLKQQPATCELCRYFSGAEPLAGSAPLAQVYSGHQFGQYVPQLGDGRGLLLGQVKNKADQLWELHLKGAGKTPFSRMGDGRAVLRSSIREFLASEAMRGLNIPTSHALCVIGSDTPVMREEVESAATLLRVAESHLRFGHFEYFFFQNRPEQLKALADFAIKHHFPECEPEKEPYLALFEQAVVRTARLIAKWQAAGFTHGVMNTDNMSLLGLTFDYGPYGFMDAYQQNYIPNHSDHEGRYAYAQQPGIGYWNLQCLARALSPLISAQQAQVVLESYQHALLRHYSQLMASRFGLNELKEGDAALLNEFMLLLEREKQDLTRTFRGLSRQNVINERSELEDQFINRDIFREWWRRYRLRRIEQGEIDFWQGQMLRSNPKYTLRTHLAHTAIEQAKRGDFSEIENLQQILQAPYDEHSEFENYAELPPEWSQELEVSCSS